MKKMVEISLNVKNARAMLECAGFSTLNLSDDEVFDMVLERIKCYGVDSTIIKE